ncbi:AbiJ-NTD4 domain-containing protein [Geodermatophilus sp. SYSU D00703]
MRFSERHGYTKVRTALQHESLDEALRLDLWNYILGLYEGLTKKVEWPQHAPFLTRLWADFLRRPLDEITYKERIQEYVKAVVLRGEWFQVYDFIEFLADEVEDYAGEGAHGSCVRHFNALLEKHLAAYRFVDGRIVPIDSTVDLAAVEDALSDSEGLAGVRHHLQRALELLADREAPDYSNSIKESISAVESVCALITNKKTLGEAVKRLKDSGLALHPALEQAWLKLYGFTSDADGIRHFAVDAPTVDQAQAKYFLVTCSAFVSLLITEAARAGVPLEGKQ